VNAALQPIPVGPDPMINPENNANIKYNGPAKLAKRLLEIKTLTQYLNSIARRTIRQL
jgi:hypothetical protein